MGKKWKEGLLAALSTQKTRVEHVMQLCFCLCLKQPTLRTVWTQTTSWFRLDDKLIASIKETVTSLRQDWNATSLDLLQMLFMTLMARTELLQIVKCRGIGKLLDEIIWAWRTRFSLVRGYTAGHTQQIEDTQWETSLLERSPCVQTLEVLPGQASTRQLTWHCSRSKSNCAVVIIPCHTKKKSELVTILLHAVKQPTDFSSSLFIFILSSILGELHWYSVFGEGTFL